MIGFSPENLCFIPGQMTENNEFVSGQIADKKFVPGQTVAAGKTDILGYSHRVILYKGPSRKEVPGRGEGGGSPMGTK